MVSIPFVSLHCSISSLIQLCLGGKRKRRLLIVPLTSPSATGLSENAGKSGAWIHTDTFLALCVERA